ncbi:cysteine synthase A [Pediococcus claussenii]|uniref:cysteine synthase n=1 Tax=Pediococcus claussenii (strain ATCC BAA-344 / DSM 14800 / JCM 18046 / KCTC 3811 / LMG 21948 / P06) TaxID=701521 RepID=G8PDV1_PEDCP|nr:cysteine synthase A [Pediococcus claussenii]AEV95436.1 cysteine synthase A [Pediococcus claussenii ATCC BAA-344]ANZ68965.1 cysteine synthase A [Pediococcus claussenii]ANZ70781.1 cysteine synthase A [Pediococcus claussenii]KRN19078.1 cysK protein [Pediococcus claussenii]
MIKKESILDYIGKTPIIKLQRSVPAGVADVYVKLEYFNEAGSVKDRIALKLIEHAEKTGDLTKDVTLIEPTSGNTGIGIAAVAAAKGYKAILVMPDTASEERKQIMKAYGATLIETPGSEGIKGSIKVVEEYTKDSKYLSLNQFVNEINPLAHYETTGPEIVDYFDGTPDAFVAGIGTGGTLSGTGKFLKETNTNIEIIGVEPATSAILNGGKPGKHPIQGIGTGFVPDTLDTNIYDSVTDVTGDDAVNTARMLGKNEGILLGFSGGAAVWAAIEKAKTMQPGQKILALAADNGERYLSTSLYKD